MPLLIERGNVHNPLPSIAIRASVMQAIVVALLVAALVMIVLARVLPAAPAAQSSRAPITSVAAILAQSPTATPTLGPSPSASPSNGVPPPAASPSVAARTYRVRDGDTLLAIARRFRTSTAAIMRANAIAHPDSLRIGQVLVIP